MLPKRVAVLIFLGSCFPAFYAEDFRIVNGKKCVVKKRARNVAALREQNTELTTTAGLTDLLSAELVHAARPTPFKEHQAAVTGRRRTTVELVTTSTTLAPASDAGDVDETDPDPVTSEADVAQAKLQRESKNQTEDVTTRLPQRSSSLSAQTTSDSKGQFMDLGDFDDFDDSASNTVTAPSHVKRDFVQSTSASPATQTMTTTSTPTTTTTTTTTETSATMRRVNKVKSRPLVEPTWVVVNDSASQRAPATGRARATTTQSTTTRMSSTTTTLAAAVTTEVSTDTDSELDDNYETDIATQTSTQQSTLASSTKSAADVQKKILTDKRRLLLVAAANQESTIQMGLSSSSPATILVSSSTEGSSTTTLAEDSEEEAVGETTTAASTMSQTSTATTASVTLPRSAARLTTLQQIVAKRQEAPSSVNRNNENAGRSIRVVDADSQQNVGSSQSLLSQSKKALQLGSFKLAPPVDKGENTTGLQRVDGPDSPLLDGSYLSDPWMCRVKRDTIKSPIIMENCSGEKKQIVDLRVYKLVGIPIEECITTPVVLGDRCTSLNGGRARCAQRYVRYGLIAQDLDSDRKGHECFRFPSACLCQLIVGDTSPLPAPDAVATLG